MTGPLWFSLFRDDDADCIGIAIRAFGQNQFGKLRLALFVAAEGIRAENPCERRVRSGKG